MTTDHRDRTPEEQERLNAHMREKPVLEWVLFHSLNARPATRQQVEAFLATAPPEVFVLLDELIAPPAPGLPLDMSDSVFENPIVRGFIGLIRASGGRR